MKMENTGRAIFLSNSLLIYGCIFIFFFASMRSFYFNKIGISFDLFCMPLLSLMVILSKSLSMPKKIINHIVMYFFIFICWCIGIFNLCNSNIPPRYDTALAFILIPLIIFLQGALIFNNNINWKKVFKNLVLINILLFYFQLATYYLFDYQFDLVELLTGNISRNIVNISVGNFGYVDIFRASGLFDEPGTYVAVISVFIAFLYIYDNFKISCIGIFAIGTLFLSLSVYGFIAAFIFILHFLIYSKKSFTAKSSIILLLVPLTAFIFYYSYWRFLEAEDSSLGVRILNFEKILETHFGIGFVEPITGTMDWGLIPYLYLYFGIFSFPLIFLLIYFFISIKRFRVPMLLLFLSKIPPTAPLFWLFFVLFLSGSKNTTIGVYGPIVSEEASKKASKIFLNKSR